MSMSTWMETGENGETYRCYGIDVGDALGELMVGAEICAEVSRKIITYFPFTKDAAGNITWE